MTDDNKLKKYIESRADPESYLAQVLDMVRNVEDRAQKIMTSSSFLVAGLGIILAISDIDEFKGAWLFIPLFAFGSSLLTMFFALRCMSHKPMSSVVFCDDNDTLEKKTDYQWASDFEKVLKGSEKNIRYSTLSQYLSVLSAVIFIAATYYFTA